MLITSSTSESSESDDDDDDEGDAHMSFQSSCLAFLEDGGCTSVEDDDSLPDKRFVELWLLRSKGKRTIMDDS